MVEVQWRFSVYVYACVQNNRERGRQRERELKTELTIKEIILQLTNKLQRVGLNTN